MTDGGFDWASMCDEPIDEENEKNAKRVHEIIRNWSQQNKRPTLFEEIRSLGYSVDMCYEIIDAVKRWMPKESSRPSYETLQWDKCVRRMLETLE